MSAPAVMVELKQPWTQTSWRWHVPLRLLTHQSHAITLYPLGPPYWGFSILLFECHTEAVPAFHTSN